MNELLLKKTNNFDLIRLIAALQVLVLHHIYLFYNDGKIIYHYLEQSIWYFSGVNVLFLVSGYLIFSSLERNSALNFFQKRVLRIFPALLCCLFFTITIMILCGTLTVNEIFSLAFVKWILAQVTIFQFYNPDIVRDFGFGPPNGALWTISVELQFYIVSAFIWYFFLQRQSLLKKNMVLVLLMVGSAFFNRYVNQLPHHSLTDKLMNASFLTYYYYFLLGALVWLNKHSLKQLIIDKFWLWLLLFVSFCIYLNYNDIVYERYNFNFISFLMMLILAGLVFSAAHTHENLSGKLLKGNDISYGIYIYQMPMLNLFVQLKFNTQTYQFVGCMLLTVALGFLSWILLEKRILKKKVNGELN